MVNWKLWKFVWRGVTTADIDDAIAEAVESGDWPHVMWLCDRHLKKNPQAIPVVLARARCYQAMNLKDSFKQEVALAYALDDTFVPAIFQQAAVYIDDKKIDAALEMLSLIKDHPLVKDGVNSLLGNLCMRRAQAHLASEYQLRAWMANFDGLRHANSYLFGLSYADVDEQTVACEHQFWAQTLRPLSEHQGAQSQIALTTGFKKLSKNSTLPMNVPSKQTGLRIRIGYWGGDFKEHSVRYFFRPLLESHDKERFEIFIYDDNFMESEPDGQTVAMQQHADHYFGVWRLNDIEVVALIESHQLDVLVDLQGHTSSNRLHLWQRRMAPMQITGLAYPPTTGLKSIDFKLVDRHMINPDSARYYTEQPLVMPASFWCFDPKEEAAYQVAPPFRKNGYLTLGCWGNAAKISPALMRAWAQILLAAPTVRLQVVSHSFGDSVTEQAFVAQMQQAGIPLDRLACRVSYGRDELWAKYGEVDLILDTFPFNGGTTSCWATYAGVPVLTLAGKSLPSCMGKSIMCSLGFPEFVVSSIEDYVVRASEVLSDPRIIERFRAEARERFKRSSLGNGQRFAGEFEAACLNWLSTLDRDKPVTPAPSVPPLPLTEVLRRAQMLGYHGAHDAFDRVLQYCRLHYGDDQRLIAYEAEVALARRDFDSLDRLAAQCEQPPLTLCHTMALAAAVKGQDGLVHDWVDRMALLPPREDDSVEVLEPKAVNATLQHRLWEAWLTSCGMSESDEPSTDRHVASSPLHFHVLIVGRDAATCQARAENFSHQWCVSGALVHVQQCLYNERLETLAELIAQCHQASDVIVLVRDHVDIVHPDFFEELSRTMNVADVISPAGALRWIQKEWAQDLPEYKSWGLMCPSRIADGYSELHFAGDHRQTLCLNAAVLDGQLLAFRAMAVQGCPLDETLAEAGYWAEEDWVHRLGIQGVRLAIHRHLGVVIHPSGEAGSLHTTSGLPTLLGRLGVDLVALPIENYFIQTVQVRTPAEGMKVAAAYLVPTHTTSGLI